MTCSKLETDIALYAGGDLPCGRIARVEAHLAECADCRALAQELRALQSALRDEPLEDALLAQVHQRVMAQLGGAGFSLRGALAPLLALAAAVILAAGLLWPRHHSGAGSQPAAASHAAQAEVGRGAAGPNGAAPLARKVHHRLRRAPAAQPGPPLLVQFVTDNPDIVVYWLIDQKPQGD